MKHQAVDLAILAKYLLPASIIILIVLYLFFRRLVISYVALKTQVQAAEKAAQMRRIGQPPAKTEPIIVRRTDLYDQLTPQQKIVHKQAEDLAVQKNFREASKLFESINFQRKAIDLLEFNGFIEDAAQILLRMKVPYRAAIIYDRNGQFVRAAECFALDGKHDSAARSFEKAAGADYHFFKNAGQAFLTAGMTDNALEVYGKIL
ncbi:MAG: hypothetical protein H7249_10500, partial [Chitinophagaceae bacterium]|nr:hypothetical protein [Oligoflexus sp.]